MHEDSIPYAESFYATTHEQDALKTRRPEVLGLITPSSKVVSHLTPYRTTAVAASPFSSRGTPDYGRDEGSPDKPLQDLRVAYLEKMEGAVNLRSISAIADYTCSIEDFSIIGFATELSDTVKAGLMSATVRLSDTPQPSDKKKMAAAFLHLLNGFVAGSSEDTKKQSISVFLDILELANSHFNEDAGYRQLISSIKILIYDKIGRKNDTLSERIKAIKLKIKALAIHSLDVDGYWELYGKHNSVRSKRYDPATNSQAGRYSDVLNEIRGRDASANASRSVGGAGAGGSAYVEVPYKLLHEDPEVLTLDIELGQTTTEFLKKLTEESQSINNQKNSKSYQVSCEIGEDKKAKIKVAINDKSTPAGTEQITLRRVNEFSVNLSGDDKTLHLIAGKCLTYKESEFYYRLMKIISAKFEKAAEISRVELDNDLKITPLFVSTLPEGYSSFDAGVITSRSNSSLARRPLSHSAPVEAPTKGGDISDFEESFVKSRDIAKLREFLLGRNQESYRPIIIGNQKYLINTTSTSHEAREIKFFIGKINPDIEGTEKFASLILTADNKIKHRNEGGSPFNGASAGAVGRVLGAGEVRLEGDEECLKILEKMYDQDDYQKLLRDTFSNHDVEDYGVSPQDFLSTIGRHFAYGTVINIDGEDFKIESLVENDIQIYGIVAERSGLKQATFFYEGDGDGLVLKPNESPSGNESDTPQFITTSKLRNYCDQLNLREKELAARIADLCKENDAISGFLSSRMSVELDDHHLNEISLVGIKVSQFMDQGVIKLIFTESAANDSDQSKIATFNVSDLVKDRGGKASFSLTLQPNRDNEPPLDIMEIITAIGGANREEELVKAQEVAAQAQQRAAAAREIEAQEAEEGSRIELETLLTPELIAVIEAKSCDGKNLAINGISFTIVTGRGDGGKKTLTLTKSTDTSSAVVEADLAGAGTGIIEVDDVISKAVIEITPTYDEGRHSLVLIQNRGRNSQLSLDEVLTAVKQLKTDISVESIAPETFPIPAAPAKKSRYEKVRSEFRADGATLEYAIASEVKYSRKGRYKSRKLNFSSECQELRRGVELETSNQFYGEVVESLLEVSNKLLPRSSSAQQNTMNKLLFCLATIKMRNDVNEACGYKRDMLDISFEQINAILKSLKITEISVLEITNIGIENDKKLKEVSVSADLQMKGLIQKRGISSVDKKPLGLNIMNNTALKMFRQVTGIANETEAEANDISWVFKEYNESKSQGPAASAASAEDRYENPATLVSPARRGVVPSLMACLGLRK
jgi:hypothetical protein